VTDTAASITRTWSYSNYTSFGAPQTVDGPRTDVSDTTHYTYNICATGFSCGQLATATNALNQITTVNTYNGDGLPLTMTDANGVVTALTYDARQRLKSRQFATETTSLSYYPTGLLQRVTLPDGADVQHNYNNAHQLTSVSDGAGNSISYTPDAMGNVTATSAYDPSNVLSRTHTRVFNTLNQLYQDIGAANTPAVTTTYGYDGNGNQTSVSAPVARNTGLTFDELNRVSKITDAGSGSTIPTYDPLNNVLAVLDPKSINDTYTYNAFGQPLTQAIADLGIGVTTNTYDTGGNMATSTDPFGAVATFTYDVLNRVNTVAYKKGNVTDQTLTFAYDSGTNGTGRLTSASDANHAMTWGYDALGRVNSKGQTVGGVLRSVGYTYTNADLTTLATPSGQSIVYTYSNGQIASISINGTVLVSAVTFEPFGPVRGWTWGNATTEVRLHNTDGNISTISGRESTSYGYDNAFRITSSSNSSNSALSWTYGYDVLDRLTSASRTGTTQGFTYDADGSRKTETGTVSGTYGVPASSNRLNSITGTPARTYTFDQDGSDITYAGNTLAYNYRGRLKSFNVGSVTTSYRYNAVGQRIQKSGGPAGTVLFVYDEKGHLLGEYTGTGALIQETVWLNDLPVATIQPASGGGIAIYYIHADHLGAPHMITRPSDNAIVWRWDADPFGSFAPNQNPSGLGTFSYNPRFPGQYADVESGLFYNYSRDYDPQTGRYIESDPTGLAAGANSYAYANGNPLSLVDPLGLAAQLVALQFGNSATMSLYLSAQAYQPADFNTIVVHGTTDGQFAAIATGATSVYTPEALAYLLTQQPGYDPNLPTQLVACSAGATRVGAQRIATALGQTVFAPDIPVGFGLPLGSAPVPAPAPPPPPLIAFWDWLVGNPPPPPPRITWIPFAPK
jgi:RHS repeat-associated protein